MKIIKIYRQVFPRSGNLCIWGGLPLLRIPKDIPFFIHEIVGKFEYDKKRQDTCLFSPIIPE